MLTGQLVDRGLPQLLNDLHQSKFTGQLTLLLDAVQEVVYLRQGEPVQVTGKEQVPLLGELMVEMGLLTEANHRFSLATTPPDGQRYGFVLMRYGLVTPEVLQGVLVEQIRRRMARLFQINTATYQIVQSEHGEGLLLELPIRVSAQYIIYEGIKGIGAERLALLLQPVSRQRVTLADADPAAIAPFGFGPEEQEVIELVAEGLWTPMQLVKTLRTSCTLPVLYALYVTGLLVPASLVPEVAAPAPAPQQAPTPQEPPGPQQRTARDTPPPERRPAARDLELLRLDIEHLSSYVMQESHFRLLGVDDTAHWAAIDRALAVALRTYDPQEIAGLGVPGLVDRAQLICARLKEAAQVLKDPMGRRRYLQEQRAAPGADGYAEREAAMAAVRARRFYARGRLQLRRRNFAGASLEFEAAARCQPECSEFLGFKTWARFCAGHIEPSLALRELQRAIGAAPQSAALCCFAGAILRQIGELEQAEAAYVQALLLQPGLAEAEVELNALREQAAASRGSKSPGTPKARSLATPKVQSPATPRVQSPATPKVQSPATPKVQSLATPKVQSPATPKAQSIGAGLLDLMRRPLASFLRKPRAAQPPKPERVQIEFQPPPVSAGSAGPAAGTPAPPVSAGSAAPAAGTPAPPAPAPQLEVLFELAPPPAPPQLEVLYPLDEGEPTDVGAVPGPQDPPK